VVKVKKEKVFFKNSKKQKICGLVFIPDGEGPFPVLVVCHGLSSSKESTNTTMSYPELLKNKIVVFAFDFSGHGESEGNYENVTISQAVDDLNCALNYIEAKDFINKNKIGLLGSSFGGLTSVFVTKKDKRIKSLALKSPNTDFKYIFDKRKNVKEWKQRGYIIAHGKRLNYSFYLDGINYNAINIAKEIKVPTLVVIGDKDKIVFSEKAKEFFDSLECEKEFHWIENAEHWFTVEEKKEVFRYINNWFIKWLK